MPVLYTVNEPPVPVLTEDEFNSMKERGYFSYGLFRINVTGSSKKLFRENKHNYYTHIDLNRALELKYDLQLIQDGQPNFLYYERSKLLTGKEIFGKYVDFMYLLKQDKVPQAKEILNILWGTLSEKHFKKVTIKDGETININKHLSIHYINPIDGEDDLTHIKFRNNDTIYKSGWARICPFIISKGRSMISKIMQPYINNVVRCHTDGFICSEKPHNIQTGQKIGQLRYERYNPHYHKVGIVRYNKDEFVI